MNNYSYLKLVIIVLFLIVIVSAETIITSTQSIPTFHQFYGEVRGINNNTILESVKVSTYIDYEQRGSVYTDNSLYGYSPLLFVENGHTGDRIDFFVDYTYSTSYIYEEEGITELILIFNDSGIPEDIVINSSSYKKKYNLSDLGYIIIDGIGSVGTNIIFWIKRE